MTFPVLSANGPSGYNLTRSLRFRASATAYLSRTPATATNRTTWTWSGWVKRGQLSATNNIVLFSADNGTNQTFIRFRDTDILQFGRFNGTSYDFDLRTTAVYRDPSAFYHILAVYNSGNATSSSRVLLYINGVQVTAFGTASYPTLSFQADVNSTYTHGVGALVSSATKGYCDGYMAEVNFIDGQALTPSSFGSTNATTGVWQPARYTGTYGTNGFYLPFTNTTSTTTLGYDSSGNGNNWTTNNISLTAGATYDSMTDVPTLTSATAANYCTLNPLLSSSTITFSSANLNATVGASGSYRTAGGTIAVTSGKWYFESIVTTPLANSNVGVGDVTQSKATWESDTTTNANFWFVNPLNGNKINGSGTAYGSAYSNGDIINCAVDMDNGKIWWGVNGTYFASGDPAAGTNAAYTNLSGKTLTPAYFGGSGASGGSTQIANFGQRPFSYTPPSGFVALNTYNLPASTVPNGAAYMAATTYTGTGASLTVANTVGSASFQPDFVWAKGRSGATDHALYDSVRGVQKQIESNNTGAEITETTGLTAFGSTGFTVGALAQMNTSSATYVAWQWKGGGTAVSNTSGTITSSVSANTTSGCSVVTYTGSGVAGTIGHGLGVAPSMIIVKSRSAVGDWPVYHTSVGNGSNLLLNTTAASVASATIWNATSPTSTVFSVGINTTSNTVTVTYVAYCFAAIKGFSAFGSYTGNSSTDGPFIYTGFRPRYVLIKRTDASTGADWFAYDTSRNPYNTANLILFPNLSNAESASGGASYLDILSNGFKARGDSNGINASAATYIYMAFAESPFQNSLAR